MNAPKKQAKSTSNKLILEVTSRTIFGKKLTKLRKEGLIPANIFGPQFKSTAISIPAKNFITAYKTARATGIVYVKLDKQEIPVLFKNIQRHPVTDEILHADFRKIDLTKKIQTEVPVKVIGQSEAVTQKAGVLLTQSDSLLVEALPKDIPSSIEVDISVIKELGREIKVGDLAKSTTYTIVTPPEKVIVSVVEHKEESIVPETAPTEAPEVITEKVVEGEEVAAVPGEEGKKEAGATPAPAGKPGEAKPSAGKTPPPPAGKPQPPVSNPPQPKK